MEYPAYICDICHAEKRETNHWFAVNAINELQFKVLPWEEAKETVALSNYEHICGADCLHKRLSQWLEVNSRTSPERTTAQ